MNNVQQIEDAIQDLRIDLQTHPLYKNLTSIQDIQIFMENHVFAVWDFMSLLKSLQKELTCTTLPWVPAPSPILARFINEIVHGEESDVNEVGEPKSHFEMYLEAMEQIGASTQQIDFLLNSLSQNTTIETAVNNLNVHNSIKQFILFTFNTIATNKPHLVASVFAFGREDIIPDMFINILKGADKNNSRYPKLVYYLNRHVELDGDEHGPLSLKMITELCGNDSKKWQEATEVAQDALMHRIALWNAISDSIIKCQKSTHTAIEL